MPWKCMECGCVLPLMKRMRSRSPSVQRSVGPGMRPLKVQAGNMTPGAISTSLSTARTSHSRTVRPSADGDGAGVEIRHDRMRVEAVAA